MATSTNTSAKLQSTTTKQQKKVKEMSEEAREFQLHLQRIFYIHPKLEDKISKYDTENFEYFGVLNIIDPKHTDRKLWYLYYCQAANLNETVEHLRKKFGKQYTTEIFCEHTFSGSGLCHSVKKYFTERKFYTKGKIIEAPRHETRYTNASIVKAVMELHKSVEQKLYNELLSRHDYIFGRYGF